MSDFKANMHHIRFRLGALPQTPWKSLQRSPRLSSWISGAYFQGEGEKGEGKARRVEGKGKEGRGGIRGAYF